MLLYADKILDPVGFIHTELNSKGSFGLYIYKMMTKWAKKTRVHGFCIDTKSITFRRLIFVVSNFLKKSFDDHFIDDLLIAQKDKKRSWTQAGKVLWEDVFKDRHMVSYRYLYSHLLAYLEKNYPTQIQKVKNDDLWGVLRESVVNELQIKRFYVINESELEV